MIAYYEKSLFTQMLHKYQPIVPKVFEKNIIKIIKEKGEDSQNAIISHNYLIVSVCIYQEVFLIDAIKIIKAVK